jgi:hypothetical protein
MRLSTVLYLAVFLFSIGCVSTQAKWSGPEFRRPSSENQKVVFTSNVNKATEILFFGNLSTAEAIREFIQVLDQVNSGVSASEAIKLRLMLELTTDFSTGVVPTAESAIKELGLGQFHLTHRAADLPASAKHLIAYVSTQDKMSSSLWLQDFGEFYYANNQPTFLDLHYSSLEETSEFHRYIISPKGINGQVDTQFRAERDQKTINTTLEGGDIEALPNGVVLTGNLIHPELEKYLTQNLKQTVLKVAADFVATGHVDEVFAVIPAAKEHTNGCGYALAYIDPLYGLRLALDRDLGHRVPASRKSFVDAISYFTKRNGESLIHRDSFQKIPKYFKSEKTISSTLEPWGWSPDFAQWYVHRTVNIHNQVEASIAQIKESLKASCPNLKTVGLPVLMSDFGAGESTFSSLPIDDRMSAKTRSDLFKSAPVYLHLSPVNMLVLNQHLVMPAIEDIPTDAWDSEFLATFQSPYKRVIKERFKKELGLAETQLHFVNANVFVANGGSLHCGSATFRDQTETVY